MRTKVIYKERDANGVQVAIREKIYDGSTWRTDSGTLTVYRRKCRVGGCVAKNIASFPYGDWIHAEDPDHENNPES